MPTKLPRNARSPQVEHPQHPAGSAQRAARRRAAAMLVLLLSPLVACVIPMDTSANAVEIAMEQVDYTLGVIRDENAMLQRQVDSLSRELKKTDSLLRSIANLTGNPIVDPPIYIIPPQP